MNTRCISLLRRGNETIVICAALGMLVATAAPGVASASAAPTERVRAVITEPSSALAVAAAAAVLTPPQAVAQAHAEAVANGITDYVSVADAATGAVLAQSANAGTQVASESIVKLMIAAYYLVLVGGYQHQSASVLGRLSYMIRYSDDATASAYFSSAAVPTMAARYGMSSTINATDRVGHWGAVRITAHDMTTFLFHAFHDPQVGPWLKPVMAQVAAVGSDGFNQAFGMNSLAGVHGSKQGWGDDEFWSPQSSVINSVGFTDRYVVAILQNSDSYPDPARATSSFAARTISAARAAVAAAPPNGTFVTVRGAPAVYRIAGGAPIYVSSFAAFGGSAAVRTLKVITAAQFTALRSMPVDGTFLLATGTGAVYRIAGGAPVYVSSWAGFGGPKPMTQVDNAAITNAGLPGVWSHLAYRPMDGTYLTATSTGQVFRVVSGTPTYVSSFANFPGSRANTVVDAMAISRAGQPGFYSHLRRLIPDGTFIRSTGSGTVFRIAGGAPVYVSTWSVFGGSQPTQAVDAKAIIQAGQPGPWAHLNARPVNGTYLSVTGGTAIYRMAGGAPVYVSSFAPLGGPTPNVQVDAAALSHGGQPGVWAHLLFYPAVGTFLTGMPGGRVYRVAAGHPFRVASWAPYGGPQPTVAVTQLTVDRAGAGGLFAHLK